MRADLSFLSEDVAKQRALAQDALDQATELGELLKDESLLNRHRIKAAENAFLKIASELAKNAIRTSTAAVIILCRSPT